METAVRYTLVSLFLLPICFMAIVAILSAMLVLTDIPFRN